MINLIPLVWYGAYGGGVIGSVLAQWEQMGFFSILLPFLLIFAVVFGILSRINLFQDNKAVNAIIALAVGLIAVNMGFVSVFFSAIFPRLAIGLSILLVVVILLEFFTAGSGGNNFPKDKIYFGIGAVILISILVTSSESIGFNYGWWSENWPWIVGIAFILAIVGIIVGSANNGNSPKKIVNKSQ